MNVNRCELEEKIVAALASAGISDSVRQHIAECETCREVVSVDAFMKEFARTPIEEPALPDGSVIWLKAQLMQQDRTLVSIVQSSSLWQTVGFIVVALAWAITITWKWSAVELLFKTFEGSVSFASVANSPLLSLPFITTIAVLACATVGMAVQSVLMEDI
jgi:hypothetical protein